MKMRKLFIALLLMTSFMLVGSAEEIDSEKFQKSFEKFARQLELRENQKLPSKQILLRSAQSRAKILESYGIRLGENTPINLSFRKIRRFGGEMRKVGEQTEKELSTILDSDQMRRYRGQRKRRTQELSKELRSRIRR